MVDAARHPGIQLMTYSELKKMEGSVGNFHVTIEKRPRYVSESCNSCDDCVKVCPITVPNEFDQCLSPRHAIYQPFRQAVPSTYVVDIEKCIRCYKCVDACGLKAIDFSQEAEKIELDVGSIILATGFEVFDPTPLPEYGYGRWMDVITGMDLERLLDPSGPTKGKLIRPSDSTIPGRVAFVQCAGSRDERHIAYCSGYCCMASIKTALHIRDKYPGIEIAIFYIDIRTPYKGYEEFFRRAREKGIRFIRGKPSEVIPCSKGHGMVIHTEDIDQARYLEWETDLVILATGAIPSKDGRELGSRLSVSLDENGFFREYHPKLRPIDSPSEGIFFAGAACGPKDIPYSVSQGSAAAARSSRILMNESLTMEPIVAKVDPTKCLNVEKKCGVCAMRCPFNAITTLPGEPARVTPAKCVGCGTCSAECPGGCITIDHYTDLQIFAQIHTLLAENPESKILAFMCRWCSYPGADNAGLNRLEYPPSSRGIRVMCSGRIKRDFVLEAFRRGAGMVLVSGCHSQDCHYIDAQSHAERRLKPLFKTLERMGISPERFRMEWISAAEGAKYAQVIIEMDQALKRIGQKQIKEENAMAHAALEKRLPDIPYLSFFPGETLKRVSADIG
jgi:heterodisulfide reductase subunit A